MLSKGMGEVSTVQDSAFLYAYDLEQWQLDKMKEHGERNKGYFTFKGYSYYPDPTSSRGKVTTHIQRRQCVIKDKITYDTELKKGSFKTKYYANGQLSCLEDISLKANTSVELIKKTLQRVKSININGVSVYTRRVCTIAINIEDITTGEIIQVPNIEACKDFVKVTPSNIYNAMAQQRAIHGKYLISRILGAK